MSYSERNQGRLYEDVISELNDRVTELERCVVWDEELRKHNPALQDLFEKYLATKKLIE